MGKKRRTKLNYRNPKNMEEQKDLLPKTRYRFLEELPSYVERPTDSDKVLYSYSDSRIWLDLSPAQKMRSRVDPHKIYLVSLAVLLGVWFVTSFIYRMCAESDKGLVALTMLPSFLIVAVCIAILLLSVYGLWGKFVRFALRNNLAPKLQRYNGKLREELDRADNQRATESAITVTERYVVIKLLGEKFVFQKDALSVKVKKVLRNLQITFDIDGQTLEFPAAVPISEYVPLKKSFVNRMQTERTVSASIDMKKFILKEIPAIFFALLILTAAILLVVAHYLWVPGIPPFLGIFFIGAAGLAFCNIFSVIPVVGQLGFPFLFAFIFLVIPPYAYVWFETEIFHNPITFVYVVTHCSVYAAGFAFFWLMGFYCLANFVSKTVDYIRFGRAA